MPVALHMLFLASTLALSCTYGWSACVAVFEDSDTNTCEILSSPLHAQENYVAKEATTAAAHVT